MTFLWVLKWIVSRLYPALTRCLTCEHPSSQDIICAPKCSFHIKNSFPCTSKNLIYCLSCLTCGKLYIGETKRMLSEHFREHLRDIKKNSNNSPVSQHFNSTNHSINDITVSVLLECSTDYHRKSTEMKLINKLGTLDPFGLNLDFSYNIWWHIILYLHSFSLYYFHLASYDIL